MALVCSSKHLKTVKSSCTLTHEEPRMPTLILNFLSAVFKWSRIVVLLHSFIKWVSYTNWTSPKGEKSTTKNTQPKLLVTL